MEKEERHQLRQAILTAKANNDNQVLIDSFNNLLLRESVDWYEIVLGTN